RTESIASVLGAEAPHLGAVVEDRRSGVRRDHPVLLIYRAARILARAVLANYVLAVFDEKNVHSHRALPLGVCGVGALRAKLPPFHRERHAVRADRLRCRSAEELHSERNGIGIAA